MSYWNQYGEWRMAAVVMDGDVGEEAATVDGVLVQDVRESPGNNAVVAVAVVVVHLMVLLPY